MGEATLVQSTQAGVMSKTSDMSTHPSIRTRVARALPIMLVAGLALAGCVVQAPAAVPAGSAETNPASSQRAGAPRGTTVPAGERDDRSGVRHVELRVSGDGAGALIRDLTVLESEDRRHHDDDERDRENAAGATEHALPWSTEFDLTLDPTGDYQKVIVWAQNTPGNFGEIRCEIYVDGERKSHHDEDGDDSVSCDRKLDLD